MSFEEQIKERCKGLPKEQSDSFLGFCNAYAIACQKAHIDPTSKLDTFYTFLSEVAKQLQTPYHFPPYHTALQTPIDYYTLGLDFIRPLLDISHSKVLGKEHLKSIQNAIDKKNNVVLFANHQTEIDPQIISLLIENEHPVLAKEMIFVAGHRVITDPLAVPLSLGRNLICIYSKRHVDHPPEKKAEKFAHNQKALKALQERLNQGGACIYIAPSGGRDRKNEQGQIEVCPFDPDSIELFWLLAKKSERNTHFHTLALATYELLPPPDHVLNEIGETRTTHFNPAHLAFSPKLDMEHIGDCHLVDDKKEKRQVRSRAIFQQVALDYKKITS